MIHQLTSLQEVSNVVTLPKLVIIDCYAQWCGPCKTLAPALEALSKAYPAVHVCKVDVDACDIDGIVIGGTPVSVISLPTIIFTKNGQLVETVVGCHIQKIEQLIQKHM